MLWEILKASKGILVTDLYADLWANIAGGGTPVDVIVEMIGSLPLYYEGKGYELIDYLISGNAIQDGTPSPDAPVDATGCGAWDEPYGFKLPPTVNGTEYPIYLGQVETTRRVKKLVLTGNETWVMSVLGGHNGFLAYAPRTQIGGTNCICNHYKTKYANENNTIYFIQNPANGRFIIFDDRFSASDDFKSYLASQYAAGTPVTVWYVLATPETAVVNEPLMKIGDYADTISYAQSGVTIPTVSGANVLDTTSPVKPSEVYIKGKGIKPTGYGQLVDKNGVRILDKNDVRILVHGQ